MNDGIYGAGAIKDIYNDSLPIFDKITAIHTTYDIKEIARPQNLVLYLDATINSSYPGSGILWNDLSGKNNHATLVNGPTFAKENGGVIIFDGTNDHARILNSATLNMGADSWTAEAWLKIPTYTTAERIIFEYGPWPNSGMYQVTSYGIGVMPAIRLNTLVANSAGKALDFNFPPFSTNRWLHIVGQLDTIKDRFRIFINGLLLSQNSGVTQNNASITRSMYIMSRGGTSLFLRCNCGALLIYNTALSSEEIWQNYNKFKERYF